MPAIQSKPVQAPAMEGTAKPAIPEALRGITIDAEARFPRLANQKILLAFDEAGRISAQSAPSDACVMSTSQLLKALNEPNGLYVSTDKLAAFAIAVAKRLQARRAFYCDRGESDRLHAVRAAIQSIAQVVNQ